MFIPITIDEYFEKHLAANPSVDRAELRERLQCALAAALAGERCACGNSIWVIGSAEIGLSCFACITGEAVPREDYEIVEALDVQDGSPPRSSGRLTPPLASGAVGCHWTRWSRIVR